MSCRKREDARGKRPFARTEQQNQVARKSKQDRGDDKGGRRFCKQHIARGEQRHQEAFAHAAQHQHVSIDARKDLNGCVQRKQTCKNKTQSQVPPNSNGCDQYTIVGRTAESAQTGKKQIGFRITAKNAKSKPDIACLFDHPVLKHRNPFVILYPE